MADENKLLKAWHASPYDFEKFGPMRDVSGKGQGAASYGRGAAYVAESPAVSGPGRSTYMEEFSHHPHLSKEHLGGADLTAYLGDEEWAKNLGVVFSKTKKMLLLFTLTSMNTSVQVDVVEEGRILLSSSKIWGRRNAI